jgi:ribosomal protein S12 methylthiotransferase
MARVGMISLGCPKNLIDGEEILGELQKAGHHIETDAARADVLIINTCGFIKDAKEESIDSILDAVRYKTNGACRSVIVTGCLAQRYGKQLAEEIPEIDAVLGLGKASEIPQVVARTLAGTRIVDVKKPSAWWLQSRNRVISTAPWTAYLRVADGCDNRCTYCAIPSIRGSFRSRPKQMILDEAKALADLGVQEINLVAQDTTRYGLDSEGHLSLPNLLEELAKIEGIRWIRLLYCYPTRITDELIATIAAHEKICKYIDLPLQHCSDLILRAMGRQGSKQVYLSLIDKLREECPDIALRTTFIVGFPGETEEMFNELMEFVENVKFDRVGVFTYSSEEGTPAVLLPGKIHHSTAKKRRRMLMNLQEKLSLEKSRSFIGKQLDVLVEGIHGEFAVGRSYRDAPDIDGLVRIYGCKASPGEFVTVQITEAESHDLVGKQIG